MGYAVGMDVLCELASAIVERQWEKVNYPKPHSIRESNGDIRYIDEVQDEFNEVLDMVETILNGEEQR